MNMDHRLFPQTLTCHLKMLLRVYRRRRKLRNIETFSRRHLNNYSILRNPSSQGQAVFDGCYFINPPASKILEHLLFRIEVVQELFSTGVVNTQKFGRACGHVVTIMFTFGTFTIKKLINRIISRRLFN